ncbi:VanZ family protein [Variovorax sp. HJSM1_2]|uniref:VanZ family protein n=1 Tax=Variovorax sp. HJSM1_2 TaxID=3366263 RepID=UPI003BBD5D62
MTARPAAMSAATADTTPNTTSVSHYRIAVGLVLLLIVYGSLFPLEWNFAHPQAFLFNGTSDLSDVLENVALFFPLGCLLAARGVRSAARFVVWFCIALVVAAGLQWLQKFLPRTPALSDVLFNMLGHVLGWGFGAVMAQMYTRAAERRPGLRQGNYFVMALLVLWLVAELFPLVPSLNPGAWLHKLLGLLHQPWWEPRRLWLHLGMTVMGLAALAEWLHSVGASRAAVGRAGVAAGLLMLLGKFVVWHQNPGLAVVLGILAGVGLWWLMAQAHDGLRTWLLFGVALITYGVHALWPFQWPGPPKAMLWLPFASSLSSNIESVITTVALESLCFGSLIWGAVRRGLGLPVAAVAVALLAFGAEWSQRYQPARTAEITSVLLALGMAWLVAALGKTRRV